MQPRIAKIILDLSKADNNLNEVIKLRQGETNSTVIQANITNYGKDYDLNNSVIELHMKKPNSEIYVQKATIDNNQITCKLDAKALTTIGKSKAYFLITNSDFSISTGFFKLQILPGFIPPKKEDPNKPQPIDLQIMQRKNADKTAQGVSFG